MWIFKETTLLCWHWRKYTVPRSSIAPWRLTWYHNYPPACDKVETYNTSICTWRMRKLHQDYKLGSLRTSLKAQKHVRTHASNSSFHFKDSTACWNNATWSWTADNIFSEVNTYPYNLFGLWLVVANINSDAIPIWNYPNSVPGKHMRHFLSNIPSWQCIGHSSSSGTAPSSGQ